MNSSTSISKLAKALVEAQAEMPRVKFDTENKFLKTGYASLGAIVEVTRPVLVKHGLAITQFVVSLEGRIGVRSILIHESGEYIEDTVTIVPEQGKGLSVNQSAGVSITYLKRYSWAGILGIVTDEDTDGDLNTGAEKANEQVKSVMARTWSIEQMETVIEASNGGVTEHMDASEILDLSVLPENAPTKTIRSWFKHYLASDGKTALLKAAEANEAYQKAKKTGGK